MKLIAGLGNPGEKYEKTRHNLGFIILDHLLKDLKSVDQDKWEDNPKLKSEVFILDWQPKGGRRPEGSAPEGENQKIILAKPKTYMNNSGMAVSAIVSFYKIDPSDIWVIHDELDLPLGTMKIRFGGSGAGHHGVESIIKALGTDKFWRFRMGIGISKNYDEIARHKFKNTDDFVLDRFTTHDTRTVKHLIKRGADALKTALEKDMHSAMNRFNTK
ncbi:MAG: aminoacyl-tRNA hydrolase [Candidatus Levybacteria bacterium CG10_big_fil_rev_8_21_14_0_10_35_13]|nr:MAG: aminoacyl-tRNA hydrolase [Candidatus Levybacteria bacterium CG10_big_fil_rev_8_21_14_0_10_35_13]